MAALAWQEAARSAHTHAAALEQGLLAAYPAAWPEMDRMREAPPVHWPDWCLLPMAAAAAVAGTRPALGGGPIAALAALYAWRFARSVYVFEPALMDRLLGQVPDEVTLDDMTGLPEWCVYIPGAHAEAGPGLWAHLEHDVNTGRPELRLLLDVGDDAAAAIPIPVYLDRPSLTEALADFRATAVATARSGRTGADVRGGQLGPVDAALADRVDGFLSVLAYLARPEADIVSAVRPGLRPVRSPRPVAGRHVWLVGTSA